METIKAIPTRYKGVVYRSRSEARFAAFLEFSGGSFTYEPQFLRLPNMYTPDFAMLLPHQVIDHDYRQVCVGFPISLTVIEYKPKLPNQEWLNSLHNNFREIAKKAIGFGIDKFELCLVTGTVYDEPEKRKVHWFNEHHYFENNLTKGLVGGWDQLMRWERLWDESIEYAKGYRYDLEEDREPSGISFSADNGAKRVLDIEILEDSAAQFRAGWDDLISTGIPDLDNALGGGYGRGEVVVLAGRPGHGHDLLAEKLVSEAARTGEYIRKVDARSPGNAGIVKSLAAKGSSAIVICDLCREIEKRSKFIPRPGDAGASLENLADVVVFCVYPNRLNSQWPPGELAIFIYKNGNRKIATPAFRMDWP